MPSFAIKIAKYCKARCWYTAEMSIGLDLDWTRSGP